MFDVKLSKMLKVNLKKLNAKKIERKDTYTNNNYLTSNIFFVATNPPDCKR